MPLLDWVTQPWRHSTQFRPVFGTDCFGRMVKDEKRAHAFRLRVEQEKIVQCNRFVRQFTLALIDAVAEKRKRARIRLLVELMHSKRILLMARHDPVFLESLPLVEKDLALDTASKAALYLVSQYGRLKLLPWYDPSAAIALRKNRAISRQTVGITRSRVLPQSGSTCAHLPK